MWAEFLNSLHEYDHLAIVGPLFRRAHIPVMPTVYVDGGSDFRADGGWAAQKPAPASSIPVISIGDGDSASGKLDEVLPAHKDYSDLAFVLRSLPAHIRHIDMFGFIGERRDHELANLGEVHRFLSAHAGFAMVHIHSVSQTILAFCRGRIDITINGIFSVMVFEPTIVKISGACDYPLAGDVVLPIASSLGLSNVGRGEVHIESEKPCFIFAEKT
jgi:thiamine pyrophosphokinase